MTEIEIEMELLDEGNKRAVKAVEYLHEKHPDIAELVRKTSCGGVLVTTEPLRMGERPASYFSWVCRPRDPVLGGFEGEFAVFIGSTCIVLGGTTDVTEIEPTVVAFATKGVDGIRELFPTEFEDQ